MNEVFIIDREFLFKTSIHEITSLSVEHNFDINGTVCEGELIISGDYKLHEISINKEDFSFKIPFSHKIRSNINLDTVDIEITDFDYEFSNNDELKVHIEYILKADESIIEFEDEEKLKDFLENTNNIEIVNILEDVKEEENRFEEIKEEEIIAPLIEEVKHEKDSINENIILNSINTEEEYIKYHVHTVTINDTIENILEKYNISLTSLKKYNSFETLELNMKLIIPENEEL